MAGQKCHPACGSVTPPCCPGEGEKGAGYELCSNCAHSVMLDKSEGGRMKHKFDLCHLMAKEGITFEKDVVLYKL